MKQLDIFGKEIDVAKLNKETKNKLYQNQQLEENLGQSTVMTKQTDVKIVNIMNVCIITRRTIINVARWDFLIVKQRISG